MYLCLCCMYICALYIKEYGIFHNPSLNYFLLFWGWYCHSFPLLPINDNAFIRANLGKVIWTVATLKNLSDSTFPTSGIFEGHKGVQERHFVKGLQNSFFIGRSQPELEFSRIHLKICYFWILSGFCTTTPRSLHLSLKCPPSHVFYSPTERRPSNLSSLFSIVSHFL